ncbi:hypothetical protein EU528_05425 [Candidatus Thorarchaeota archaeon]|nr:MAG: hypothetical protein EU528_05425 [Candidatus Thorarchaeota archaeon]
MIRNLIIIDANGRGLLSANFGECHSFGEDNELVSGFISAVYSFSKMVDAETVDEIQLGNLTFLLISKGNLVFALSADDENSIEHKATLVRIIDLFEDLYDYYTVCVEPDIDIAIFKEFPKFLVDQDILQPNCGNYTECKGCPNSTRSLPVQEMTRQLDSYRT